MAVIGGRETERERDRPRQKTRGEIGRDRRQGERPDREAAWPRRNARKESWIETESWRGHDRTQEKRLRAVARLEHVEERFGSDRMRGEKFNRMQEDSSAKIESKNWPS